MSIKRRISLDRIVEAAGLSEGQTNKAPRDPVVYYVLAPNQDWFMRYVRKSGRELQACKAVTSVDGCLGLDFTNPNRELVVLDGWALEATRCGQVGDGFVDEGHYLISRYCLQKRVHAVPMFSVYE